MGTYTEGSSLELRLKEEAEANVRESGTGATVIRRVSATIEPVKQEVTSAEKRSSFQEKAVNHGTRSSTLDLQGEGFVNDYSMLIEALLRRDFAAVSQISASSGDGFTIDGGVLTRAGGGGSESFIEDGVRAGMIVRLGGMTETANNGRNLLVTAVTATTLTLQAVDGGAAIADDDATNESATITIPGQVTFVPQSSHTSKTFTAELYDRNSDTSRVAWGVKVGSMDLSVQPDSPVNVSISGLGIDFDFLASDDAPSFTAATAAGTGKSLSAAIGYAQVNGQNVAVITGLDLSVNVGLQNQPVAFASASPDVFYGRVMEVTGTISVLKSSVALEELFDAETELSLVFFLEAPGSAPRDFWCIYMRRVKINGASLTDPDGPAILSLPFRALEPDAASGVEQTTIMMQDGAIA